MLKKIALLVDNSSFRHKELQHLSAPSNDVRNLAKLLEYKEVADFDRVDLKFDVSLVDARAAIGTLYRHRHTDDLLLFYYSGHGLRDASGTFYLALTETGPSEPDSGSLDEHWIRRVMNESASRRRLTVLDCCHSGAMIPEGLTARDAANRPAVTRDTFDPTDHGRYVMTATTADASVFEHQGRSLYTRFLIEGLEGGGAAPDSDFVSVHDLHAFVKNKVAENVTDLMMPQLWTDVLSNPEPLLIAKNSNLREKLDEGLEDQLFSMDEGEVELDFYRLKEAVEEKQSGISDEAADLLKQRLEDGKTLSFDLGLKIYKLLDKAPPERGHPGAGPELRKKILELELQLNQ